MSKTDTEVIDVEMIEKEFNDDFITQEELEDSIIIEMETSDTKSKVLEISKENIKEHEHTQEQTQEQSQEQSQEQEKVNDDMDTSSDDIECEVAVLEVTEDDMKKTKHYENINTKWTIEARPNFFEDIKDKLIKNLNILGKIEIGDKLYVYDGYLHKDDRHYFQSMRRYSEGSTRTDLIVPIINTYHYCFVFKNEMRDYPNYQLIIDSLDGLDNLMRTYPDFQELMSIVNFIKFQFLQTYRVMKDESVQFNKKMGKFFILRWVRYMKKVWSKYLKRRNRRNQPQQLSEDTVSILSL